LYLSIARRLIITVQHANVFGLTSSIEKLESDHADGSNDTTPSMERLVPGGDSAIASAAGDGNQPSTIPPKKSRPQRCRLYPICNARPCRLFSHRHYVGQRPAGVGRRDTTLAGPAHQANQAPNPSSPLARIGNPGMDPFIQYPFQLTTEMQELVHSGQLPLSSQPSMAIYIASLFTVPQVLGCDRATEGSRGTASAWSSAASEYVYCRISSSIAHALKRRTDEEAVSCFLSTSISFWTGVRLGCWHAKADISIAQLPMGRAIRGPQRHLFPSPHMSTLLAHVIQDSGSFQGYLASLATIMVLAKNKEHGMALSQQGRAIKFLISACKDTEFAATDNNIMTAAFVTTNELAFGNVDAAEQNLCGINYLVKTRGGLHNLGMGGIVAAAVSGVDQYLAIFKNSMPTYNISVPTITLDAAAYPPGLGRAFRDLVSSPSSMLDPWVVRAGVDFGRLMDIYERGARNLATPAELTYFEYLQAALEHQLTRANARYHGTATENECVCLAMLLCNLLVCRNFGTVTPFHHVLASRLWRSLHLYHIYMQKPCTEERANLGIWLLLMSISTALDGECPHASDAMAMLRFAREKTSVRDWEDLKNMVLNFYVWSEVAQGKLFQKIWHEVENFKEPERTMDITPNQDMLLPESTTPSCDHPREHSSQQPKK
jgi:hypothetical protein